MDKVFKGFVWLCFLLLKVVCFSQETNYKFTHIGTPEGLSQGSVYAMLRDSQGFMWFGTQDGLNCMKGKHILSYFPDKNNTTSISGSKITSILEDTDGNVWIGTENGLSRKSPYKDAFKSFFLGQQVSILAILGDEVYIWCSKSGYLKLNRKSLKYSNFHKENNFDFNYTNTFNSTLIVSDSEFWIHENEAIIHLKNNKKTYYFSDNPTNKAGGKKLITKLKLHNNQLYLATENGIEVLDYLTGALTHISTIHGIQLGLVLDFDFDNYGNLWLCLENNGLLKFSPELNTSFYFNKRGRYRKGLWDNLISYIYIDPTNTVWVNPDPFGVDKIEQIEGSFEHTLLDYPAIIAQEKHNQSVRSFCEIGDKLWIGTLNSGIWILNKKTMEVTGNFMVENTPTLTSNRIFHLVQAPDKTIYAGTSDGLVSFRQGKIRHFSMPSYKKKVTGMLVRSIEKHNQLLYLCTEEGIVTFNTTTQQVLPNRKFADKKMELTYHLSDKIFFAGFISGGLWLVENQKVKEILKTDIPLFVLPKDESHSTFWVGSNNGLFIINNKGEVIRHFTVDDGLPNNFIYQGQIDQDNNLWLSTNRGLACLKNGSNTFVAFNLNDGLQDYEYNAFASFKDSYGKLYFGGVNGFNHFFPGQIEFPDATISSVLLPNEGFLKVKQYQAFLEDEVEYMRPDTDNAEFLKAFKTVETASPNFLYTDKKGWVHFKIRNATKKKWFLEIENTRLNEVELWVIENGREISYQKLGDALPFEVNTIRDPNPTFELNLLENQEYDFYIKTYTTRDFKVPVSFWSEVELIEHQSNRKLIWGIFAGFILLISFYNIFLWLTIKDKTYLFYTIYILSFGLFQFSIYGFAYQYFWSNHPVNEYAFLVFLSISYIFIALFTEKFLELNERFDFWSKIKWFIILSNLIFIMLLPIAYSNEFNYFSIFMSIGLTFFFYFTCYKLWNKEDRIIRYYAIAIFFLTTASTILALQNLGIIDAAYQEYVLMTGSMLEIVLFSMALGYKFRRNVLEKERQQQLRNELSNNLHDDLAASLSSLSMYAELSKRKVQDSSEEITARLSVIGEKSRNILEKVREAVYELDPRHDANDDWLYRIINFGKEIFTESNTDFKAEIAENFNSDRLKINHRREVIYLFKEAINNAAKYADAQQVVFFANYGNGKLILELADNGKGFKVDGTSQGNGLTNMKKRAENCKAILQINSDKGTEIRFEIPTY